MYNKSKSFLILLVVLFSEIFLITGPLPAQKSLERPIQYVSPWLFPDSDSRYLTVAELAGLSSDELWIARNEIYARRGFIFSTARGKAYAQSLGSAYFPRTENPRFNKFEQKNIHMIQSFESRMR
ncbi:MAG: YARHG domain-containing protein [Syntrophobacteraceae bacterium]